MGDKVERVLRACAAQFSLARLLMAAVLLALAQYSRTSNRNR